MIKPIAAARLANHCISKSLGQKPEQLVAWMGAVQSQNCVAAKWALGLRLPPATTERQIDASFERGEILRTHVLRPTWHFVAKSDVDWMIRLTAARVHRTMASTHRSFQLDSATRVRAARVMERALRDGEHLTRAELGVHLKRARLPSSGAALGLLTIYAELERVMHSGQPRGKELTYVRYSAYPRPGARLIDDEAIAELAKRYFSSHGPATIHDFVWWSSLTTAHARRGLEANQAKPRDIDGVTYWTIGDPLPGGSRRPPVHLLPIYDEYYVAYRDRIAVPLPRRCDGVLRFEPVLLIDGQFAGRWTATRRARVEINVVPDRRLSEGERTAIGHVVERYARFTGLRAALSFGEVSSD